jgi:FMN phosphatase YigB (HAD superfamily)
MKDLSTIIFDLDGTLLGIDDQAFEMTYFKALAHEMQDLFEPKALVSIIWQATKITVADISDRSNQEVFLEAMQNLCDHDPEMLWNRFMRFYEGPFDVLKEHIQPNPNMLKAVNHLYDHGYQLAIATNPLFPKLAVDKRIQWANLDSQKFQYVSSFEGNASCKPQLKFYQEVIGALNVKAEHCLMVGNDPLEDMIAKQMGMRTYLLEDYMVKRDDVEPMWDEAGSTEDFLDFVYSLSNTQR